MSLASDAQLTGWVGRFACYRQQPSRDELKAWLGRFEPDDIGLAHKILDSVIIVSEREIHEGYKDALTALPGWSKDSAQRVGRWFFVGAGSAGESGPAMLRMFREANGLTAVKWQSYFITAKELPRLNLSAYDSIVFVDDFAGTGKQMTDYWPIMQELVASEATCYLILTAVTSDAQQKIIDETELTVSSRLVLNASHNLFSDASELLSSDERKTLERLGKIAWKDNPRGYGNCGLTLVLSHKTPNNTIPILHANHKKWVGPFPRNLLQTA